MLSSYLRRQYKLVLMLALFAVVFAAVFSLYDLPAEAVGYAAVLCLAIGLVLFAAGYCRYVRRHRELMRLLRNVQEAAFQLPPPSGALEADYQTLLRAVCADRAGIAAAGESARQEMMDYYTLWAHQIKTPISAMITRLLVVFSLTNVKLFALCTLGTLGCFGVLYALVYWATARTYYKIVRA